MLKGIDFSFGNGVTPEQIKAAGYRFVGRYLTGTDGNPKDIDAWELIGYLDHGLVVILVFEIAGQEFTEQQGAADALAAQAQLDSMANLIGRPDLADVPVFFAQDLPPDSGVDPVAYQRGVCATIGRGRSGIYGDFATVKACFDAGVVTYGWQTSGMSGGEWDNRALLRQDAYGVMVGPATCDVDQAAYWASPVVMTLAHDFGQWPRPMPPFPFPAGQFISRTEHNGYDGPPDSTHVGDWQQHMHTRGWTIEVDGKYGPQSEGVCSAFQEEKHLPVDGKVNMVTWNATWALPIT